MQNGSWNPDKRVLEKLKGSFFYSLAKMKAYKKCRIFRGFIKDCYDINSNTFLFGPNRDVSLYFGLQDVYALSRLPVDGKPVICNDRYKHKLCKQYLGQYEEATDEPFKVKASWLRMTFENVPPNATDEELSFHVRAYLLHLIGTIILPDRNNSLYYPVYRLQFLTNLDPCALNGVAWGAAAHCMLTFRGPRDNISLVGPWWLYELFFLERIPKIRDAYLRVDSSSGLEKDIPLYKHWFPLMEAQGKRNRDKVSLRQDLESIRDNMTNEDIILKPYEDYHSYRRKRIFFTRAVTFNFDNIAYHEPEKGPLQLSITKLKDMGELNKLRPVSSKGRRRNREYYTIYAEYIKIWDERHNETWCIDDTDSSFTLPNIPDQEEEPISNQEGTSTEIVPSVAEGNAEQLDAPSEQLRVVEKAHEDNVSTVASKRKRGTLLKLQAKFPESRLIASRENEGVDQSAASVVESAQMKEVSSPTSSGTKSLEKDQEPLKQDKLHDESQEQDLKDIQRKKYSSGRGKRGTTSTESPMQDFQEVSKEKSDENLETRKTDASAAKLLDIVSDDQPLSRCINGMHSPIPIHCPASKKELEAVTCDPNAENLPFMKRTPFWRTIEAMEAFQKIPQNPHFRPLLEGVKGSAREGVAIGTMVTFSTVVDSIKRLRFEDPRSTIEDCLETLVEMESNGFNVEVIKDRFTCLLQLKVKQEELEDGTKGVIEKIEEQKIQDKTVGDDVDEIDRQIQQLEETRRKVLLKKEEWKLEVDAMKATEGAIEQKIIQLSAEFDGLAAAPL